MTALLAIACGAPTTPATTGLAPPTKGEVKPPETHPDNVITEFDKALAIIENNIASQVAKGDPIDWSQMDEETATALDTVKQTASAAEERCRTRTSDVSLDRITDICKVLSERLDNVEWILSEWESRD